MELDILLSHSTVNSGKKSKMHKMKTSEIYYIIERRRSITRTMISQNLVSEDQAIYIPPHSKQYIENTGKKWI